jgi:hypothetical protein
MVQLNLLPDVKIAFLRTARNKRLVIGISGLAIVASLAVLILLGSVVYIFQKKNLSDLNKDIVTYNNQLKNTPDLDKVLTVQNQLTALTPLHEQKPAAIRVYDYLTQLTPTGTSITQMDVDFEANTVSVTCSSKGLDTANTHTDTLKFTKYVELDDQGQAASDQAVAFSDVVLTQFSRNSNGATYTITMTYDPTIFDVTKNVKLVVPDIISTRSLTEQPTDLFQSSGGQKQ